MFHQNMQPRKEIVVRRAENDEKFVTLDGQERTMDDQVLMICDGEKAVGIAGIMGGENSMITDVQRFLFLQSCPDHMRALADQILPLHSL